jgi:hypothetical protein
MRIDSRPLVLVVAFFLSGCATIVSGTTQKIPVSSDPTGAVAKVDGTMAAVTPTIFNLERKTDHTIEISKEGYKTAIVAIRRAINGAAFGNILAGGIIGVAVDMTSGANQKLVPDRVDVILEKGEGQVVIDPKIPVAPKAEVKNESKNTPSNPGPAPAQPNSNVIPAVA